MSTPEPVTAPVCLAVFASGGGSNLQALLDHFGAAARPAARVVLVVASRPGIGALDRARRAGVATAVVPAGAGEVDRLRSLLGEHRVGLVVLAGYLRLVPAGLVREFAGRIVNIHPALLPAFGGAGMYGMHVHRAVVAAGVRVSGATVHRVDDAYDKGEILAQWPVPVFPGDSPEALAARVLAVEHRLLPAAVEALARPSEARAVAEPTAFAFAPGPAPDPAEVARLVALPAVVHLPQPLL